MKQIIKPIKVITIILSFIIIFQVELSAQMQNKVYTIEQGDTAYSIANRYGVSLEDIYALNPWARNTLRVGEKLLLPDNAKIKVPTMRTYIIKPKDTMYSVCKRFGISEEQLMSANTNLSAYKFPAGRGINIPPKDFTSTYSNLLKETEQSISKETLVLPKRIIDITLALPFLKDKKYIEFYKGFLMGLNDEKQKGISVNMDVVDLQNDEKLQKSIDDGSYYDKDLIIGGISKREISDISKSINRGYYIVPFNGSSDIVELSNRIVQINTPDSITQTDASNIFLSKYADNNIYIVTDDNANESLFIKRIKIGLTNEGKAYNTVNLDDIETMDIAPNSVIVPVNKKGDLLQSLLSKLPRKSDFTLFGYPLWQSFSSDIIDRLHYYNTTIFSSFYFNQRDTDAIIFLNKFKAWYNESVSNSMPLFSVIGYDVARYFIDTYAKNYSVYRGTSKDENKYLQMDFTIKSTNYGAINKNLFFITYLDNGMVERNKVM